MLESVRKERSTSSTKSRTKSSIVTEESQNEQGRIDLESMKMGENMSERDYAGYKDDVVPIDKENECSIRISDRMSLVCPAYPEDCSYLRLVIDGKIESGYWHWEEWKDDPQVVIGAIMGIMNEQQMKEMIG